MRQIRPRPHVSEYFWIHNSFFPDSKISPSTRSLFKSNSPVHPHPMVSGFTLVPKAPLHYNAFRACAVERDSGGKFALFARHVVPPYWFIVRLETGQAFYVTGFNIIRIHPSTRYRIRCESIFFHSGGRIYFFRIRCRIRWMRVDGSRIWKGKVAESKISGYV